MAENNDALNNESASTVGDPYNAVSDEIIDEVQDETGRVAIVLANEKQYKKTYVGPINKKCVAREGEIAVDEEGNFGIFRKQGNKYVWQSRMKELDSIIQSLEDLGVLNSARAFAANSNINNLYFDNSKKLVNLNPNRLYRRAIRYYAIRSQLKNELDEYEWITGVMGTDEYGQEALITPLMNMTSTSRIINGDTVTLSEPVEGSLIRDMVNGETYTVVFYDADRRVIGSDQYDAISVSSQGGLLAPNTAIVDLVVESSRIGPDEDSTYLYVGESAANIALRVFVKYADNRTMEVTSESFGNGRLVIEGLDSITTEYPSDDNHLPFDLTIKYYLTEDNSNNKNTSLTKSFKVYVKEDIYDSLLNIVPAGVINGEPNLPTTKVKMKIFGLYQSGTVRDITPLTKVDGRLTGYDNAVYNSNDDTWDAINTVINTGSHEIVCKIPQGIANVIKQFKFNYETSTSHRRFIINGLSTKFINFNAYTGKMSFEENVSSTSLASENEFVNEDGSKITPTHFSIKSAMNPEAIFVDKMSLDNIRGFSFNTATGRQPYSDMPLIVEFCKLTEGGDGVTTSVFVTSAVLYYAKQSQ